jgi:hypothetical protein
LAIWWPESEYKPLPANSLSAFEKAIDRRTHYGLHTCLNLVLSADLQRHRVVLVRLRQIGSFVVFCERSKRLDTKVKEWSRSPSTIPKRNQTNTIFPESAQRRINPSKYYFYSGAPSSIYLLGLCSPAPVSSVGTSAGKLCPTSHLSLQKKDLYKSDSSQGPKIRKMDQALRIKREKTGRYCQICDSFSPNLHTFRHFCFVS